MTPVQEEKLIMSPSKYIQVIWVAKRKYFFQWWRLSKSGCGDDGKSRDESGSSTFFCFYFCPVIRVIRCRMWPLNLSPEILPRWWNSASHPKLLTSCSNSRTLTTAFLKRLSCCRRVRWGKMMSSRVRMKLLRLDDFRKSRAPKVVPAWKLFFLNPKATWRLLVNCQPNSFFIRFIEQVHARRGSLLTSFEFYYVNCAILNF